MNIIFDLDGTLIDSSEGILRSVESAFKQCNITLQQPLQSNLIGPPLHEMLKLLAGTDQADKLEAIADSFKEIYDTEGYKLTNTFGGIDKMLDILYQQKHTLYLLTNKRFIPTHKIIEYFSWKHYFKEVYTLDQFPEINNKTELIAQLIKEQNLAITETVYIGDTLADLAATKANKLHYIMAMWGYDSREAPNSIKAETPQLLLSLLNHNLKRVDL